MNPYDEYPTQDEDWGRQPYHAHVSHESRDCDGRYSQQYVFQQYAPCDPRCRCDERHLQKRWDDDLTLLDKLILHVAWTPDLDHYDIRITRSETGGWTVTGGQDTEEGFTAYEARMCQDPTCDLNNPGFFRDHTAESMGY